MMVGDVLADRYELEELVGSGGMSSVYRAYDRVLERRVALKVLHQHFSGEDEYVQRFLREARTVAGLSHPNIVTVIDRGEHDGQQFIVFEYVDGENLKHLIQRNGPAPVDRALELAVQIGRGLSAAHERGLVHRDVKPQNVLLNGDGKAKVTDFGIAREIDVQHGMTQTGTVLGTSDYISPEQAQGLRVDEHTDVYSLGVVLYELLTGELPFKGDNFVAVAMGHINDPPPSVLDHRPDVPLRVAAAIDRALAKNPNDRWPTMADFCRELQECLREFRGGGAADATVVLPPPKRARRSRATRCIALPTLLVLAGLGVLAAALAIILNRSSSSPPPAAPPRTSPLKLSAVSSFSATGPEHPERVQYATDDNPNTYWETHHYYYPNGGLGKPGVGLVLDAGQPVRLKQLTVMTDTPGFTAEVEAGASEQGPFHAASAPQTVSGKTTFNLAQTTARFFVLWITNRGPNEQVHVNEINAS